MNINEIMHDIESIENNAHVHLFYSDAGKLFIIRLMVIFIKLYIHKNFPLDNV